jgi:RHS repeat-associated protein
MIGADQRERDRGGRGLYTYDPYGKPVADPVGGTNPNPWRYASGYYSSSARLSHFGARYYDPNVGSWTQPDPSRGDIKNPLTLDVYLYLYATTRLTSTIVRDRLPGMRNGGAGSGRGGPRDRALDCRGGLCRPAETWPVYLAAVALVGYSFYRDLSDISENC